MQLFNICLNQTKDLFLENQNKLVNVHSSLYDVDWIIYHLP